MTKIKKRGKGRPTKYDGKNTIEMVIKLLHMGATDKQVANILNVCEETVNEWKRQYPDFSASYRLAKFEFDTDVVERTLLQKALGFTKKAIHFSAYMGDVTETKFDEYYPPDTQSLQFWLKNRRPKDWRDKQEFEHSGTASVTVNVRQKPLPPKKP